jgi:hypothetical protein
MQIFFLFVLFLYSITITQSQTTFVLKSYTVSPNYAKSTSSVYTFPFNAFNTKAGTINIRVAFPNQYSLTTANSCGIKIDNTSLSGIGCSFDSTTNQVIYD